MTDDKENLNELFSRFVGDINAVDAVEDIRGGEEMLRAYPPPEPETAVLDEIKGRISERLRYQSSKFRRIVRRAAAVAAVVPDAFEGVNIEELASGVGDVAVPIAGVIMALLASYGLRTHA